MMVDASTTLRNGSIGGFGTVALSQGGYIARREGPPAFAVGQNTSTFGARPPQDVNLAYVIENPRERVSLLDDLLERNSRLVPELPELPPLPEITRKDFAGYVSQLRAARLRNARSREEAHDDYLGDAHDFGEPSRAASAPSAGPHARNAVNNQGISGAETLGAGAVAIASREGAITAIDGVGYIDAFRAVPPEFFASSFDIRDQDTFDRLLEIAEVEATAAAVAAARRAKDGARVGSTANIDLDSVQERLTTYLDIVECQLLALIKARSREFFGALRDLQDLQTRITAANKVAIGLRRGLAALKSEAAVQPLYVVHASRRRERGSQMQQVLVTLRDADRAASGVGRQVAAGDLMGSLDLIASTRATIASHLPRVTAATGIRLRLDQYEALVGDTLVANWTASAVSLAVVGPPPDDAGSTEDGGGALSSPSRSRASGHGTPSFFSPAKAALSFDAFLVGAMVPSSKPALVGATAPEAAADSRAAADAALCAQDAAEAALEAFLSGSVRLTLEGLVRTGRLNDALESFQAAFSKELKALVRSEVAEALLAAESSVGLSQPAAAGDGAAPEASPERVAALPPSAFLRLLTTLCDSLRGMLGRVYALHETVERVLDTFKSRPGAAVAAAAAATAAAGDGSTPATASLGSSQRYTQSDPAWAVEVGRLRALSSGVLAVAVDSTQRHVARLLALRRPCAPLMRVGDMRALWEAGAGYAAAFNSLLAHVGGAGHGSRPSGISSSSAARGGAPSPIVDECTQHARALLGHLHGRNVAALGAMLDGEQWRQADVPVQVQTVADAIAASGTSYGASVVQAAAAAAEGMPALLSHSADDGAGGAPPAGCGRGLTVKGVSFTLVGTGVMLVKMLGDYSSLAEAMPDTSPEVVRCVVELLRTFNARATDLVLGARAMHTAALKRITAKHLALTCQTLGAVLALLPSLRASLIMRLPPSQHVLLGELARVTGDYMSHEQAILAKFVAIVKDLLVRCVVDMRALPWGDSEQPLAVPTPPMRELAKGVTTLHRILAPVLRHEQLLDVFVRITVMVGAQAPVQYTSLLAHLTDASVAAVAAYHEALAATARALRAEGEARPAPGPVAPPPRFSREVANERLAADVRVLVGTVQHTLNACRQLLGTPADGGAASALLSEAEAGLASGEAALHSLVTWTERQFSAASIVGSPGPRNGGAHADDLAAPGSPSSDQAAAVAAAAESAAAEVAAEVDADAAVGEASVDVTTEAPPVVAPDGEGTAPALEAGPGERVDEPASSRREGEGEGIVGFAGSPQPERSGGSSPTEGSSAGEVHLPPALPADSSGGSGDTARSSGSGSDREGDARLEPDDQAATIVDPELDPDLNGLGLHDPETQQ